MRSLVWVLLAVTACYQPTSATIDHCNLTCSADAECPDGLSCNGQKCSIDAAVCTEDPPQRCAGAGGLVGEVCFDPIPPPTNLIPGETLITDSDPRCMAASGAIVACTLVVDLLSVNLRAIGNRPLILWSSQTLTVTGSIDVASHVGQPGGPDAQMLGSA